MMRRLVDILAVICGMMCGLIVVACLFLLSQFVIGEGPDTLPTSGRWIIVATFLGLAGAFIALLWQMVSHLRKPNQESAKKVFSVTTILLAVSLMNFFNRHPDKGAVIDYEAIQTNAIYSLAGIILLYLFYRLVLKRLAGRAFPGGDTPATPAAISST